MKRLVERFADDVLLVAGGVCILIGLAQWSPIATWIAAGLMLVAIGVLIGKVRSRHDPE